MPKHAFQADGGALPDATIFLAVTPSMRRRLAKTIEILITLLDEIDGDPDFEPDGTEHDYPGFNWNAGEGLQEVRK